MDEKEAEENKEIKEIINAQAIIDEILVANSDAIKRIDKEIESMERNTAGAVKTGDTLGSAIRGRIRKSGSASISTRVIVNTRYNHPDKVCESVKGDYKCENRECEMRHPKMCKWLNSRNGCRRNTDCDYLHVTLAEADVKLREDTVYQCKGCESSWVNSLHVKEHKIFFCLNCDEWIRDKSLVLQEGWTLYDKDGNLRQDV